MTQVLCDQNDSHGGNQDHRIRMKAWRCERWQAYPRSIVQIGEIDGCSQFQSISKNQVDDIADDAAQQNGEAPQLAGSINCY